MPSKKRVTLTRKKGTEKRRKQANRATQSTDGGNATSDTESVISGRSTPVQAAPEFVHPLPYIPAGTNALDLPGPSFAPNNNRRVTVLADHQEPTISGLYSVTRNNPKDMPMEDEFSDSELPPSPKIDHTNMKFPQARLISMRTNKLCTFY